MRRGDWLVMSVGASAAVFGKSVGALDLLSPPPTGEDDEAARRHDRERRFVETTFGRIAYIDRGTGSAALFLHGFPLSSFQATR